MDKNRYIMLKNNMIDGCTEFIFNKKYITDFFSITGINNIDEDTVKYFRYKNYSNSKIFRILFTKSLNIKYSDIDRNLLNNITNIAISNNKLDVSTLMAYVCFEQINNRTDKKEFENKFNTIKLFVENELINEPKNKKNINIDDYLLLKKYPDIFCDKINEKLYFKPESKIKNIINEINDFMNENNTTFSEACEFYNSKNYNKVYKKM